MYFWIALMVAFICIPFGILVMIGMGYTYGEEFSPDDFSRRSFSYNQIPGLEWTFIKKTYEDRTTTFEESLVVDDLVQPITNKTKNWHLTFDSGSRSSLMSHECDARFLTGYLDLTNDEGDYYWELWNADYPKSAAIYWPKIADLARDQMYLKIPDVMQVAMEVDQDDADMLSKKLDDVIAKAYFELGKIDRELKRYQRAKYRLERSIEIQPSTEVSLELSKCCADISSQDSVDGSVGDDQAQPEDIE